MKDDNILQNKSFEFAVRVVKAYQYLVSKNKENGIFKQFLNSGTSIGANIEEAIGAQSSADFIAKLSIAYKEARETKYWICLMKETNYFTESESMSLLSELEELLKLIGKIQVTMKNRNS